MSRRAGGAQRTRLYLPVSRRVRGPELRPPRRGVSPRPLRTGQVYRHRRRVQVHVPRHLHREKVSHPIKCLIIIFFILISQ